MIISKARLLKHVVVLSNNKVKINWFGYSDFLSFFGNVFHITVTCITINYYMLI